jgi:hypothetical protein
MHHLYGLCRVNNTPAIRVGVRESVKRGGYPAVKFHRFTIQPVAWMVLKSAL